MQIFIAITKWLKIKDKCGAKYSKTSAVVKYFHHSLRLTPVHILELNFKRLKYIQCLLQW